MAEQPTPGGPSRLDAARARVAAAKWLVAVAAGAGFGWALLGARLANPGDEQDAPAAETGPAIPAAAPTADRAAPDELLDEFFGDGSVAEDDDGSGSLAPTPSRTFAPLPRTRAS